METLLDTKSSLDLTVKWYKNCSRNNDENYNLTLKQINYFKKSFMKVVILAGGKELEFLNTQNSFQTNDKN